MLPNRSTANSAHHISIYLYIVFLYVGLSVVGGYSCRYIYGLSFMVCVCVCVSLCTSSLYAGIVFNSYYWVGKFFFDPHNSLNTILYSCFQPLSVCSRKFDTTIFYTAYRQYIFRHYWFSLLWQYLPDLLKRNRTHQTKLSRSATEIHFSIWLFLST